MVVMMVLVKVTQKVEVRVMTVVADGGCDGSNWDDSSDKVEMLKVLGKMMVRLQKWKGEGGTKPVVAMVEVGVVQVLVEMMVVGVLALLVTETMMVVKMILKELETCLHKNLHTSVHT